MVEETLVTISEIQSPKLDVFIRGTSSNQLRVMGDIHAQYWELVSVEVKQVLEGVDEEHLDGVVEERKSDELSVGREAGGKNVVRELQDTGLLELQPGGGTLGTGDFLLLDYKVPEFGGFVGTAGNQ
jgi:hypothetical protein